MYQSRYKILMLAQAISVSYLIAAFASYFVRGVLHLPRGAFILAWVVTLTVIIASRLTSMIWTRVVRTEEQVPVERSGSEPGTVLVIGGAGYIGSALLPKLLDRGYHVRVFDLLIYGTGPIQTLLAHPRLEIIEADFRQVDKVVTAMRNVDAVIHLGGLVGDPACNLDEELTIDINLMASRMTAEVAKGSGVRKFIFASTCSVYGASLEILDERARLKPLSLYARSKLASERVLMKMGDENFAPVILRFGTIFGISGRTRFDLVVNLLTAQALIDGLITIYGGDQWRPFVHVEDAAEAVVACLEAPVASVRSQVFNVGSDAQNYQIRDVARMVHEYAPAAGVVNMDLASDKRDYRVSFKKIHSTLGYRPRWTVEDGIRQVAAAIERGEVVDYRDPQHSNVKHLSDETVRRAFRRDVDWARDLLHQL
jgi:nucleoside-diphosphate-sugar epimerase